VLDCEREVTPSACGGRDGVELMSAHEFPKKEGKSLGKQMGIAKVAVGGTRIKQWTNPEYHMGARGQESATQPNIGVV